MERGIISVFNDNDTMHLSVHPYAEGDKVGINFSLMMPCCPDYDFDIVFDASCEGNAVTNPVVRIKAIGPVEKALYEKETKDIKA